MGVDSQQHLEPLQKEARKVSKKGNIILKNNNQVNMKSSNQLYQNQTKSFKKLRKPSHQKHNSIDRAHQIRHAPVATVETPAAASGFQDPIFGGHGFNEDDQALTHRQKQEEAKANVTKKQGNPKSSKIISNQRQYVHQRKSPATEVAILQQ
jgi:hypothetical protein